MSLRVGVAVSHDAVRAVALRQKRVIWAGETPLASLEELPRAIGAVLDRASLPRWPRPVLSAAVGPHSAQIKRLSGLPETNDTTVLASVIRESVGTFFLQNGTVLLTTGVRPAGSGAVLAAAIERTCVDAIHAAARARGLRPGPIAPTAVALTRALTDSTFQWNDGRLMLEVKLSGSGLESVRRRHAPAETADVPPTPVPELASLGADAIKYADAYGAAALDLAEPLAIHSDAAGLLRFSEARRPLILAGLLLLIATASVALSPLAAVRAARRSAARMADMRPGRWHVISGALAELDAVSGVLRDSQAFAETRTSVSQLLAEFTRLLPPGAAVQSFDWSGDRGEVVVLTANAGATLAALRRLPGVKSAELVGSVTNQTAGGRELQRVTIKFSMNVAARR